MFNPTRSPDAATPPAFWDSLFFFQAEDGIRYATVTGVQTCALPISCRPPHHLPTRPQLRQFLLQVSRPQAKLRLTPRPLSSRLLRPLRMQRPHLIRRRPCRPRPVRSEERRVGDECRTVYLGERSYLW